MLYMCNEMVWNDLPEEIRSKIMDSGYIKHPVALVFKKFMNNIFIPLSANVEIISLYDHLRNLGILNNTKLDLDIEELIYLILILHT